MPIQLILEDRKAFKNIQSSILNITDAIANLHSSIEEDPGITEKITAEQRFIVLRSISKLLFIKNRLEDLGLSETVLRLPPGYFVNANHRPSTLPE